MLTHSPREAPYGAPQFELHFPKSAIRRSLLWEPFVPRLWTLYTVKQRKYMCNILVNSLCSTMPDRLLANPPVTIARTPSRGLSEFNNLLTSVDNRFCVRSFRDGLIKSNDLKSYHMNYYGKLMTWLI